MASPDVAGILDNSKELDQLRKEQEVVLSEINKMHKKLETSKFFFLPLLSEIPIFPFCAFGSPFFVNR